MLNLRPPTRREAAALVAVPAEVVLNLPLWDLDERAPLAATAAGIAIAVAAAAAGGVIPGLAAAVVGWPLNLAFVAGDPADALFAAPAWIAAVGAAAWLADELGTRARAHDLAETRLAGIRESASDAIVEVDADGSIVSWSRGAEALLGYSAAETLGRPLSDVTELPRVPGERVVELRRRDGNSFSASVSLVPTDTEGAVIVARDVGELERLARRLRDVEARHRSLTEHLPVVTYRRPADGDGPVSFVSRQIEQLLGYAADEVLADPDLFLQLVHPEDRTRVAAERAGVPPPDGSRTTYRLLARDGRVVWVRDEAVVVLDDGGRPLCVQGYLFDVSERNELRAAADAAAADARDRRRKIQFVAEAAAVLASSLDFKATVTDVARLAVRDLAAWCIVDVLEEDGTLTRLAVEHAPDTPLSAEAEAHPESEVIAVVRRQAPEISGRRMCLPLISRGDRAVGALTLKCDGRGGGFFPEDLPWAQAVARMIALAIDNARLHSEVEARSDANRVLTHVGDGVFLIDRAGIVRLWNPAAEAITGIGSEAVLGRPAASAFPGWMDLSERAPVGRAGDLLDAEALPLETEAGERWISISGVEFFGGTVYAFRDITEAHRLDELKAEFIATASHELRTPLAAVYGAAQTLRRHDFALDEAGRERFIALIVDESERLARIVNQILLANQLEVGRLDLVTEPFDAPELLERVVEAARTHAPPHITLDVDAAEETPPVAADKDRVRQVLVNLVENAIKYSPGGGRVELGVEPANGSVLFHVSDEGLGIPEAERERIFEKFYRLDPEMTQGVGGTGLGLYICNELVERMGGRIWVESAEGEGSSFWFQLPSAATGRLASTTGAARRIGREG